MTSHPQPRARNIFFLLCRLSPQYHTMSTGSIPPVSPAAGPRTDPPPLQPAKTTVPCFSETFSTCGLEIKLNKVLLDKKLSQRKLKQGRSLESPQQILMI